MQQLDIFTPIAPTAPANHARGATLEEQFAAFHVPAAAEAHYSDHEWLSPKTNRPVTFHRVELKWMER